ncbi:major facilitator superfamily domain-containing protein [Suillus subalutaceus]|uniref:major facilitator superfamily domain-containing protein n=1 Tax=Suillus subalutaceus TaxID=48586 RepID=UPI001B877AAA|nr:major facilitator superfamily domain-containing protein [Suillus subalutaceus]KAG1834358.1 major facilitator superfamily domain-containing protein [Suillus subalutaceus]
MATEESPLLTSSSDDHKTSHEVVYDRFTRGQKRWIVFIVSCAGLLPKFVAASLVPSIPQVAEELHSTHAAVSLTVSLSTFATAVGTLVWAAYSSFYGRRKMYLCGIPFLCVGSCGVAMANSLWGLLFWQFVQTFGCSGGLSLGAGVIGDIYKLEERGIGIGIFLGAMLFGFAVAPFLGGVAAQYWSWRNLHYSLAVWGLLELFLIYVSVPETSHPGTLGIDKLKRRRWIHITWVNPLSCLWLLRSPNLFAVMLASSLALISDYVLLVPLAYTIGVTYGITNKAIIGACFLPNGLGNFIGAPLAGCLSDVVISKWQKKRKGVWSPEDRLRATWIGGMFMVPLSIGVSGLLTAYVGGPIGLVLNLLCLFVNGIGVVFVLNPIGSYNVDVVHSRSAEITAANVGVRSFILSIATALVVPSIEHIGVAWTDVIVAVLALLGQGIIFLTIRYGGRMRASVDVGFSTIENN